MKRPSLAETNHANLVALNARIRACRRCHSAGFLEEAASIPIARDPERDAPTPRILLIGQAPSLRGQAEDRPFAGIAGEKLRGWFEQGGIARDDFYRKIHFSAITRCYPGRLPGARGDRVPAPAEQALCRPWLDELFTIVQPRVVILIGLLAIRTYLGRVTSLTDVIGTAAIRDDIRYLPLPHPSGVSRWLNEPENQAAVVRALSLLRGWVDELDL